MWIRSELKSRAKVAFKANYWKSVLVALIASLIATGVSSSEGRSNVDSIQNGTYSFPAGSSDGLIVASIVGGFLLIVLLIAIAIGVFLLNPIEVSCNNFFICNRRNPATGLDALERGFTCNYKNIVKVQFMTKLVIALWGLLLVIPGIYKSYQYRLVPYLLAENPDMEYQDAMNTSKMLMEGQKMAAFVLDLSFIGWAILGGLTFGLLNLFYVNPYYQATIAEMYIAIVHPAEARNLDNGVARATTVEYTVTRNE